MFQLKNIFKNFFYEALDAQVLLDIETNKFILCNEKVYELYGYTQEEFLDITPYELSVEFKNQYQMETKQENIIDRGWDKFITKHKTKKGDILDIYVKSKKIEYKNRHLLFIILTDINKESALKKYFEKKYEAYPKYLEFQKYYKWDIYNKILLKNDNLVKLSPKEKKLLEFFIQHKNKHLSHEMIFSSFDDNMFTYNSLLSTIKRLRKKHPTVLSKQFIQKGIF